MGYFKWWPQKANSIVWTQIIMGIKYSRDNFYCYLNYHKLSWYNILYSGSNLNEISYTSEVTLRNELISHFCVITCNLWHAGSPIDGTAKVTQEGWIGWFAITICWSELSLPTPLLVPEWESPAQQGVRDLSSGQEEEWGNILIDVCF